MRAARHQPELRMRVAANQRGRVNKVTFDGAQDKGWYGYLVEPLAAPDSAIVTARRRPETTPPRPPTPPPAKPPDAERVGHAAPPREQSTHAGTDRAPSPTPTSDAVHIVQFPHPGGEPTVPKTGRLDWNISETHKRKFLLAEGSTVDTSGRVDYQGPLAFWGEWEPPSAVECRWARDPPLPTVLYSPRWHEPDFAGERQNTDPWVFGPAFLYSNCHQLNRKDTGKPSPLQSLGRGSLILFGSGLSGDFVIDTVFVVASALEQFTPAEGAPNVSEAFRVCTVESLAQDPTSATATYTLIRGATPDEPVNGMFSFVPCRRSPRNDARFARPAIRIPGMINPTSTRAPSGYTDKDTRSLSEAVNVWGHVVDQVLDTDLELGIALAEPPKVEPPRSSPPTTES